MVQEKGIGLSFAANYIAITVIRNSQRILLSLLRFSFSRLGHLEVIVESSDFFYILRKTIDERPTHENNQESSAARIRNVRLQDHRNFRALCLYYPPILR